MRQDIDRIGLAGYCLLTFKLVVSSLMCIRGGSSRCALSRGLASLRGSQDPLISGGNKCTWQGSPTMCQGLRMREMRDIAVQRVLMSESLR